MVALFKPLPKPSLPVQEAAPAGTAVFSGDFSYVDEFDGGVSVS
jgi:hypothetical protein